MFLDSLRGFLKFVKIEFASIGHSGNAQFGG